MSDDPAQARRRRWRWITLAELLAVAGVLISALALLDAHSARSHEEADRAAAQKQATVRADQLLLTATPRDGGRSLQLAPASGGQVIQSQEISFPGALGVAPVTTTGDPRIESGWFADGLKKARKATGERDDSVGDESLPVAIETRYLADGAAQVDRAIYDVGYAIKGQFLGGSSVSLRGIALVRRSVGGAAAAALDKRWLSRHHGGEK